MSIRFPDEIKESVAFEPSQVVNLHQLSPNILLITTDDSELEPLLTFIFKRHNGIPDMDLVRAYELIKDNIKGKTLGGNKNEK